MQRTDFSRVGRTSRFDEGLKRSSSRLGKASKRTAPDAIRRAAAEALESRLMLTTVPTSLPAALSMQSGDTLQINLNGDSNYSQVDAGGKAAVFNGTLQVNVATGYNPSVGRSFLVVVDANGTSGSFSTLTLPSLSNGDQLVPIFTPTGLTLVVAAPGRSTAQSQLRVPDGISGGLGNFLGGTAASVSVNADVNVLGQEVSGTFSLGVGVTATGGVPVVTLSASDLAANFGDGALQLNQGSATFFVTQAGVAGQASFSLSATGNVIPLGLNATLNLQVNTTGAAFNDSVTFANTSTTLSVNVPNGPYVGIRATPATGNSAITLGIGAQQFTASSVFLQATTITQNGAPVDVVRGAVSGLATTLGSGGLDVKLSNGTGAFEIEKNLLGNTTTAAQFSGTLGVDGLPSGLNFGSTVNFAYNNTGVAVKDTFTPPGGKAVSLDFTSTGLNTGTSTIAQFGGSLTLQVANFASVAGNFDIQNTTPTATAPATLLVGVNNVSAFFGQGSTGVQITGGQLGLALVPAQGATASTYALFATGTAAITGVPDLTLSGTITARQNTTGATLDQTIDGVEIKFGSGEQNLTQIGGSLNLQVSSFVSLAGSFNIQNTPASGNTPAMVLIGASNVSAFFGAGNNGQADATGVAGAAGLQISAGALGLELLPGQNNQPATYALTATGTASLLGVPGLTASGTITVKKNTTGATVDQTINGVQVSFPAGQENFTDVSGTNLSLAVAQTVQLSGDFDFQESTSTAGNGVPTTTITVGANNVTAFLGTSSGAGVKFTKGTLGLQIYESEGTSTYAIDATGTASLTLPGVALNNSATLELRSTDSTTTPSGQPTTNGQNLSVQVTGGGINSTFQAVNNASFAFTPANPDTPASDFAATVDLGNGNTLTLNSQALRGSTASQG